MVTLAAVAILAAARAALALHTTLHTEPNRFEPNQDEDTRPASSAIVTDAVSAELITDDEITPPAVQAELDERRKKLDQIEQGTESVTVDAHKTGNHKHLTEQSLWLTGTSRQAMTNYNDVQYLSFLEVGNQTISGILDTGSFELVVFSTICSTCGQASKYDPNLSMNHTQGKIETVQAYGSGDLFVKEAWDMVSIGPFPPKYQGFWEVTSSKMQVLQYSAFHSIIGIGPPETPLNDAEDWLQTSIENISNYTKAGQYVPDDLMREWETRKKTASAMKTKATMVDTFGVNMYSICFGRKPGSDGYLIWSDTAPSVKPEYFKRIPVMGNHTWSVDLSEPKFVHNPQAVDPKYEGVTLGCENGCAALLDSGTSLLAIPGWQINEIVKVSLEPWFGCDNLKDLPSIKLKLGGQEIILPPDVYVATVEDNPVPSYLQSFVRLRKLNISNRREPGHHCELMIMESGADTAQGPLWILGAPFFRQYYTTFEIGGHTNERRAVHISKASDTCTPSDPQDVPTFLPPTKLWSRHIHPSKLWVPPFVFSALRSDYVKL